jgi:hypothetical protein
MTNGSHMLVFILSFFSLFPFLFVYLISSHRSPSSCALPSTASSDSAVERATTMTKLGLRRPLHPRATQSARRWRRAQDGGRAQRTTRDGRISRQRAMSSNHRRDASEPARWGLEPVATASDLVAPSSSPVVHCIPSHPPPPLLEGRLSAAGELRPGAVRASSAQARVGGQWPTTG